MRTTVRNGTEGRRKETDGKQSVNAKNLKSDKCLFYTVLITGKNADGNSQISQAGTASVDLGRVLGCAHPPRLAGKARRGVMPARSPPEQLSGSRALTREPDTDAVLQAASCALGQCV